MYTNGVSVLFPAIPGGPHFENENGLARAKPLGLLCCFCLGARSAHALVKRMQVNGRHSARGLAASLLQFRHCLLG
jgi:hypothetical protein